VRSPLIPARPAFSPTTGKETPGTEIWTNPEPAVPAPALPLDQRMSENADKRTHTAQKRIDQQRIARNILLMENALRKPNAQQELTKDQQATNNNNNPAQPDYMPE